MKKIILASASPQRSNIIKMLGLPFVIVPSQVQEQDTLTRGIVHLVTHNAFIKAQDVAKRFSEGIVVGCDTVVYSHKKRLILKPKDFKEAKKNLLELMEKPHWVYSGITVIDAKTKKTVVDYEKTKVFMNPLSSSAINAYHRKVNPLDKAGGFDIEGMGSLFIHRIEGDYFNVVGLPLAKLVTILKKFHIEVL
jgi:septum formation protein